MRLTLYRAHRRPLTNPSLLQFLSPSSSFSSPPSSTGPPDDDGGAFSDPQPPPETKPSATSFLRDVRASLKHKEEMWRPQNPAQVRSNSPPSRIPAAGPYLDIRERLRVYRQRSSAPPPNPAQGQQQQPQPPRQQISFLKLYQRNTAAEGDRDGGVQSGFTGANTSLPSFEHIRASLGALPKRAGSNNRRADSTQSWSTGSIFGQRAEREASSTRFGGGTLGGMKLQQRLDRANEIGRMGIAEEYAYTELGEELKKLRPGQKQGQKGWFSLKELSERLSKLRELEKERDDGPMKEVRAGLEVAATMREKENVRSSSNFRSLMGITPDYQSTIPKEHLVEKYFHPDNMSSQEKMKLELAQVREEFKASESDCGSARVQVAQLTTKIKHLSSVLHKKDKHSRKGLQEMVQKRKKLLKYLRRTDWDSYCMVLSKLGLRDNPDYKNL
ncbi:unnamed protein product [Linum tenue]|uniref:Small ribosomal subunit protein uS15c n=1 Tax=Linum tenue TaxID=586396 RepID=A0AAV0PHV1_9ROSI|nr:unnamed protein product [Linum tenue]